MKILGLILFFCTTSFAEAFTLDSKNYNRGKDEVVLKVPSVQVLGEIVTMLDGSIIFTDPRIYSDGIEWRIASVYSGNSGNLNMEWFCGLFGLTLVDFDPSANTVNRDKQMLSVEEGNQIIFNYKALSSVKYIQCK
jgi:hypothetical protein